MIGSPILRKSPIEAICFSTFPLIGEYSLVLLNLYLAILALASCILINSSVSFFLFTISSRALGDIKFLSTNSEFL